MHPVSVFSRENTKQRAEQLCCGVCFGGGDYLTLRDVSFF